MLVFFCLRVHTYNFGIAERNTEMMGISGSDNVLAMIRNEYVLSMSFLNRHEEQI